jgi:hypothetical protein
MGSTVLVRAAAQAWRQAIVSECPRRQRPAPSQRLQRDATPGVGLAVAVPRGVLRRAPAVRRARARRGGYLWRVDAAAPRADGTKAGMSAEGAAKAAAGKSKLSLQEAQMILSVEPNASWEEVLKARARSAPRRDARKRCLRFLQARPSDALSPRRSTTT